MFGSGETREWRAGHDDRHDRRVPEHPVRESHWNNRSAGRVDAVPGATERPGQTN
jgi:hypothetical protein